MIALTKARVLKYKSIEDSSPVAIAEDVTVLVGKNESGKTAFLEALHKALPLAKAAFSFVFDYPRKDYVRYRPQHDAKSYASVVDLTFRIADDLAAKINKDVFHGAPLIQADDTFTRTTNYGNEHKIGFSIDQSKALAALKKPLDGIEHAEEVFANAARLEDVVERIEGNRLPPDRRMPVNS